MLSQVGTCGVKALSFRSCPQTPAAPHVGATLFLGILVVNSRARDGISGTFKYNFEVSKMWRLRLKNKTKQKNCEV